MTMCAVCRRNLLAGESFRTWQVRHQQAGRRIVCLLCETEAAREGWQRSADPLRHENATGLRGSVRRVA
ncbi:MAG TPA: hypothetical protein VMR48_05340 [Gaiellaceae bacterium]|nr:hypothetical protein [Gaiellaceae bacterium]